MKEGNDRFQKIASLAYNILVEMLFVIVVSVIAMQTTYAEVSLHHLQTLNAFCALSYNKLMRYLESRSVTSPFFSMGLLDDVDRKASFAIDKPVIQPILISLSC